MGLFFVFLFFKKTYSIYIWFNKSSCLLFLIKKLVCYVGIILPGKLEYTPAGLNADRFSRPYGTVTVLSLFVFMFLSLCIFLSLPIFTCLSDNLLLCLLSAQLFVNAQWQSRKRSTTTHTRTQVHTDEWHQLDGETKHVRTEESWGATTTVWNLCVSVFKKFSAFGRFLFLLMYNLSKRLRHLICH